MPSPRRVRMVTALAIAIAAVVVTTVCVGAASAQREARQPVKFGKVIKRLPTLASDPAVGKNAKWLTYSYSKCDWVTAKSHPATYTAELRDSKGVKVKFAWTPEDQVFDTLLHANASFAKYAKLTHTEVKLIDNQYPS